MLHFDTILIANRGEIALRILRTLKAMSLRVAIAHHAVDAGSPAVLEADIAVELHGATPIAAYLDIDQIVAAARQVGAQAVHPGYGFLSENAAFARALGSAGVVFIGPRADTIELMGDKIRARHFVAERGFPVAPSAIEDEDPPSFVDRARALGPPLLIKPSAGGGGKGMRIVRDLAAIEAEIATARREGERYFGDGRLFVERYIERPRHIEVQLLGDGRGQVVHVWERECSVQRRFQKIIEESPSPGLTPTQRSQVCESAAGIARACGYLGAGTVEFIHGAAGEFYFLEMNTRLQVEHPVTEMVCGLDLVREQVRLARGEPLGLQQADILQQGHAIECRLYAEDPAYDYRPSTGSILAWKPPSGPGVRVDAGVSAGGAVTAAFDPMIAKIICHGATRAQAIARAERALQDTVLLGVATNASYLARVLRHPEFIGGQADTGMLALCAEDLRSTLAESEIDLILAAAVLSDRQLMHQVHAVPPMHAAIGSWRN
ncbi:acetyl-CoA carboxylase biotin carboxylase subunit [Piscinibacter sakaiensis]|uniref:acetyl-CoA carboxylase biotin carboxylase subunit n=1 Tax=Piscinibacter sakaiensis TaxID=1547922 RepID=UPI003AAB58C3